MMRMEEAFDVWGNTYFWTKLKELTGYEELVPEDMGLLYAQRSGMKPVTRLCERLKDNPDRIAALLYSHYKASWEHLHAILGLTYDPIANYDRRESTTVSGTTSENRTGNDTQSMTKKEDVTRTDTGTDTRTITTRDTETTNDTETTSGSSTRTPQLSEKTVGSGSDTTIRKEVSFAAKSQDAWSEEYRKGASSTMTTSGTDKTEDTGTSTVEGSKTVDGSTSDALEVNRTSTDGITGEEMHKTQRSEDMSGTTSTTTESNITGNIGVTTSQQMIQSEIDLWSTFNFREQVMKDVDKLLTLGIY